MVHPGVMACWVALAVNITTWKVVRISFTWKVQSWLLLAHLEWLLVRDPTLQAFDCAVSFTLCSACERATLARCR